MRIWWRIPIAPNMRPANSYGYWRNEKTLALRFRGQPAHGGCYRQAGDGPHGARACLRADGARGAAQTGAEFEGESAGDQCVSGGGSRSRRIRIRRTHTDTGEMKKLSHYDSAGSPRNRSARVFSFRQYPY